MTVGRPDRSAATHVVLLAQVTHAGHHRLRELIHDELVAIDLVAADHRVAPGYGRQPPVLERDRQLGVGHQRLAGDLRRDEGSAVEVHGGVTRRLVVVRTTAREHDQADQADGTEGGTGRTGGNKTHPVIVGDGEPRTTPDAGGISPIVNSPAVRPPTGGRPLLTQRRPELRGALDLDDDAGDGQDDVDRIPPPIVVERLGSRHLLEVASVHGTDQEHESGDDRARAAIAVRTTRITVGRSPRMAMPASRMPTATPTRMTSHDHVTPSAAIRLVPSAEPIAAIAMVTEIS